MANVGVETLKTAERPRILVLVLVIATSVGWLAGAACRTMNPSTLPAERLPAEHLPSERAPAAIARAVPPPDATTPEACRACDGIWGKQGLAAVEGCNCRARDAGRSCRDGAECEGQCLLADPPGTEPIADAGADAAVGYFVGHCSPRVAVFGCVRVLPRGFASHGPVSLAAPPLMLCID